MLERFDMAFMEVAAELGVKLAVRNDHDKTFGPCRRGVVFGVEYNTEEWTWQLPEEKKLRLVASIREACGCEELSDKQAQSLVGKLINIRPLIPAGKFNVDKIMALLADSSKSKVVQVSDECKRQLKFWELALLACNGRLSIPAVERELPGWATEIFTDAAGGSLDGGARGSGGVCGKGFVFHTMVVKSQCGSVEGGREESGEEADSLGAGGAAGGLGGIREGVPLTSGENLGGQCGVCGSLEQGIQQPLQAEQLGGQGHQRGGGRAGVQSRHP